MHKLFSFFTTLLIGLLTQTIHGQCAMCKAVVENGDSGLAKGLNDGIITLMIIPYLLVAIIAIVLWRSYKKHKQHVR